MGFFEKISTINFKKPATIIKIIVGAICIIGLSFAGTYYYMNNTTTIIPDLNMSNVFEVQQWIEDNNLSSEQVIINKEYNEDIEVDQVISQSIIPENKLKEEPLIILISKGKDPNLEVDLIDFTELSEEEITNWFNENLFVDINIEYEASIDIEDQKLIRLNVEEKAKRSEMIVITMSVGTKSEGIEIIVPDFSTYTKANIEAWSNTNNIDITYKYAYSDDIEKGKVIMQDPKANDSSLTGSTGTVTISKGIAVIISNFIGKNESTIISWAKTNGIILKKLTVYSTKNKGLIVITNPKSSSTITTGDTVQYEVSDGLITLENYVNKTKSSFTTYIEAVNKENNKSARISIQYKEDSSKTIAKGSIINMKFGDSKYDSTSDTLLSINPSTTIIVTISLGNQVDVVSKANTSETSFKTYIDGLLLKYNKSATKYSETIVSGNIISNDTGSFNQNETVNYILSIGKYIPTMNDFENKTISVAQSKLNTYISSGAPSSWNIKKGTYVDSPNTSGNTVNCTSSGTTITCTISKGVAVNVESHTGKTFSEFNSYLNEENLVLGTKTNLYSNDYVSGIIISNETSSKYAGETVYYTLSLGEYTPYYSSYTNKTITEAQSALASEVPSYLSGYSLSQTSTEYNNNVNENDIISCTYSNKIVSCNVSLGVEPETPTEFTLGQIKIHEVIGNADDSVTSVQNYINGQGATDFVTITKVDGGEGDQPGSVLTSPAANTYTMLSTDTKLQITIQE